MDERNVERAIGELMGVVREGAPFTVDNYPRRFHTLEGEDRLAFDLDHSKRHVIKNLGEIETLLEDFDHGNNGALNRDRLTKASVKIVGSALGMCERLGVPPEEILRILRNTFRPR